MAVPPELLQHYPRLIDAMPDPFDSHAFIDEMRERFPELYNAFVAQYARHGRRAPTYAHGQIAKSLHDRARLIGSRKSKNIHEYESPNALWSKVR